MPLVIDGNNLLFAMHANAPMPNVGRETLLRIIERFAIGLGETITVVFDGGRPSAGLGAQFRSPHVDVQFSAPLTADDVIVEIIHRSTDPGQLRIVTADGAIVHEARSRRCAVITPIDFIHELFKQPETKSTSNAEQHEKPVKPDLSEIEEMLRLMESEELDLRDDRELFE